MTDKKRKIYIGIIIFCFVGTGGVLYFGLHQTSVTPPVPAVISNHPSGETNATPNLNAEGPTASASFASPAVFPADNKFDWSLLSNSTFQTLTPIPGLEKNQIQVGRQNPFSPY